MSKWLLPLVVVAYFTAMAGALARDRDHDGLPDRWEHRYGLSTHAKSAKGDPDGDGLINRREYHFRTDPRKRDTDSDGYTDRIEVRAGTDPRQASSHPDSPPPGDCVLNATPSNLGSQVSAAQTGDVICLGSGSYGSWGGTNKAITLLGYGDASIGFNFGNGDTNFVLDGVTVTGSAQITDGAHDITVRNSRFTEKLQITGLANANVLLQGNTHNQMDGDGTPARIHLAYGSQTPSGVTVRDSLFRGGDADGIQTGVGVNVIDNEFLDICDGPTPNHTDNIQVLGDATGTVIRGNWVHQTNDCATQAIAAYDELQQATITHNVVDVGSRAWGIEVYSDDGSVVAHNTLVHGHCDYNLPCGQISVTSKSQDDRGFGTIVRDNIATEISVGRASLAERHHNMLRQGASSGDFIGVPQFVGGSNPTSYEGYRLAPGSPGKDAASNGMDVGA